MDEPKPSPLSKLLDSVETLNMASIVLDKLKDAPSFAAAVNEAKLSKYRSTLSRFFSSFEHHFGFSFTERTGPRGAHESLKDSRTTQMLEDFQLLVADLAQTKKQLESLSKTPPVPYVSIGTWTGVALYLMPAVTSELHARFGSGFDISTSIGNVDSVLDGLMRYKYDIAIVPSDARQKGPLNLVELKLSYRIVDQGVNFLYQTPQGDNPFPELNRVLEAPGTFAVEGLVEALRASPLLLLPPEGRGDVDDFDSAVARLFGRGISDSGQGVRIHTPNYIAELHMVRSGIGVGFGSPPQKKKKLRKIRFKHFTAETFEEPHRPGYVLAYLPSKSLSPIVDMPHSTVDQTFSIYLRHNHRKSALHGGLSDWGKRTIQVLSEFCGNDRDLKQVKEREALIRNYPWLIYEKVSNGENRLLHDTSRVV